MTSFNGYKEYKYESWDDFVAHNDFFSEDMGFVFRGQRDSSWKLETTLDRHVSRLDPNNVFLRNPYEEIFEKFVKSIRGRTGVEKSVDLNEDEIWALGQHYGLATPLLDWSFSFFVALYFAFEEQAEPTTGYRTVWALHTCSNIQNAMACFNEGKESKDQFKFVDPLSDENPRLVSQSGIFTKQPLRREFNLIDWITTNFDGVYNPYLIKIDIPSSERLRILKQLKMMNVHAATLFPDLEGSAKYCNAELELKKDKIMKNIRNY
ncbi:FRG domain-containing protein [Vibrio rotiferianus]|uniref:FRG domain-containing protein n=1 Tax=Vibrio rotiferianus TaxID=190895 RepID=UPI0003A1995A|nr:FRG domain-containing protein [Vibrio rotiferianus]PIB16920.1 hypothetical protein B853_08247 [Vibrio rotiferianus CAIM 577 = LMG 21460]